MNKVIDKRQRLPSFNLNHVYAYTLDFAYYYLIIYMLQRLYAWKSPLKTENSYL